MVQPVYMLNGGNRPIDKKGCGCGCGSIFLLLIVAFFIAVALGFLSALV